MLFINGERIWNKPTALFVFVANILDVNTAVKESRGLELIQICAKASLSWLIEDNDFQIFATAAAM